MTWWMIVLIAVVSLYVLSVSIALLRGGTPRRTIIKLYKDTFYTIGYHLIMVVIPFILMYEVVGTLLHKLVRRDK